MDTLIRWVTGQQPQRAYLPPVPESQDFYIPSFNFNGLTYPLHQTLTGNADAIGADFIGLVEGAYRRNGIVFACVLARMMLLSQARFQFQAMVKGQPGDLFGTADLALLEKPEPGKVTADLLARASVDVDLAGNYFVVRRATDAGLRLKRIRADWTVIVMGSNGPPVKDSRDIDAEVIGYGYFPGGRYSGNEPEFLLAEEVAHLAPIPDPLHNYRGMSWLEPIIGEISADQSSTLHKLKFFENGATPNLVVSLDIAEAVRFNEFVDAMDKKHKGMANAYRTLYLGAGAKAEALGANFQQLEFAATQAKAETRIAMASGIHSVIIGATEGLGGSSLNQGNFMAARRLVADMTLRPWWGNFASSLEVLIPPPSGSRLWYDDRHIPFLAEDVKDAAEVQQSQASTIKSLSDAGFDPDAVVKAVMAGDLRGLIGQHSGLFSVQLQPPGSSKPAPPESAPVVTPNA